MSAVGLLILQVVMLRSAHAQFGGGGGGPSTFGYDASSACSKPYSRYGRARFEKLPCDFRRQNWCTVAGSSYPWHAVRRFVQENHGLMRRMYGDERHINILKAELEKNDIELEYEDSYQRYPDDARRFQYEDEYEFVDTDDQQQNENRQRSKSRDDDSYQGRSFTGGSIEEPTTERTRKYTKSTEEYNTRQRTRPTESSTSPTTTSSTTTTSTTTTTTTSRSTSAPTKSSESPKTTAKFSTTSEKSTTPKESSIRSSPATLSSIATEASDESIAASSETVDPIRNSSATGGKLSSTAAAVTLADIARIKNSSINEIPGQLERVKDHSTDHPSQVPIVPESIIEDTTLEPEVTPRSPTLSTIDRIGEADPADNFDESGDDAAFAASEQEHVQQEFRPRPEFKPAEVRPEGSGHESQLFQDVAAKDKQHDQPVLKLRGVNACPVKEEVVAPFWANNTRGEVLALLNLYPFEQYVHWEKCTHENKQMYCRDGCRCEQQYRLHRLLAYDPNNECRGIFSDWFKFPSCCVCRCYDLPVEFRVTSRSPRIQKQKLKLRTPGHRRG